MKKYLIITLAAGSLLATATTPLRAKPMEHKMSAAHMTDMCKTMSPEDSRMMIREMVKRKDLHKVMAEELSKNPAFTDTYRKQLNDGAHGGG